MNQAFIYLENVPPSLPPSLLPSFPLTVYDEATSVPEHDQHGQVSQCPNACIA